MNPSLFFLSPYSWTVKYLNVRVQPDYPSRAGVLVLQEKGTCSNFIIDLNDYTVNRN